MNDMIFSKETIENLFDCKIDNFYYETISDLNGNIIRYDVFIQPKQEVKHIHVDFIMNENNYGTHYMCINCDWEGHISECEIDCEYDDFKQIEKEYPYCPSCGGGVEC